MDIWIFYDGNRPVIIKYGDTATYHYELNLQGDVIAILDPDGIRVVEYTYDAWGNILSITGSKKDDLGQANPLRYRGYVYDHETGLYYLQSRYYDPKTHRFLNADAFAATGQGLLGNNMFAYCGNDPVNYEDPSGTYHRSLDPDIRSACYEAPGTKGTALAKSLFSSGMWISQKLVEQVISQSLSITDNTIQTCIAHKAPVLVPGILFLTTYVTYDKCRTSGLGIGDSIVITVKWMFWSNLPYSCITGNSNILADVGFSVYADNRLNSLITEGLIEVSPAERSNNKQTYVNNRTFGVLIGGGLRCMYTNYTGMGRDLIGNP